MLLFQPCEITNRSVSPETAPSTASTCFASNGFPSLSNSTSKEIIGIGTSFFEPRSHGLDRTHQVDQAMPFEVALAAHRRGAVEEDALHLQRLADELAANGKKRGDRARDVRSRHAR